MLHKFMHDRVLLYCEKNPETTKLVYDFNLVMMETHAFPVQFCGRFWKGRRSMNFNSFLKQMLPLAVLVAHELFPGVATHVTVPVQPWN